jgi:protein ImuA
MQSTLADLAPEIRAPEMSGRATMPTAALRRAPETLHPSLWLGHQLGRRIDAVDASGFAALDAELPGGGWPRHCLTELLLPHPGVGEMRLMAPALTRAQARTVMLFDPPCQLDAAVLISYGFDLDQLLVVRTRSRTLPGSDSLWSLEQALKSGHVGALLAWLPPRLRAERLRRLQLAAHNHDGVAFVVREASVSDRPSASPLRLSVRAGGVDRLRVSVVKRRGPPLLEPLLLDLPSVLSAAARRRSIVAPTSRDVEGQAVTTT